MSATQGLNIFTSCPVSVMADPRSYIRRLEAVSRWSDEAACEGILLFTDNRQLDPWLVCQSIINVTERLCPLVAVQPSYMHPYSVAKMITSFAFLYRRPLYLNMVAGGFRNDLLALNDTLPHDDRYDRLVEYTKIIQLLVRTTDPVTFEGNYYQVRNLRLTPSVPHELLPRVFVSGSSPASRNAAEQLEATSIQYPKPAADYASSPRLNGTANGIRIGVIVRDDEAEAWSIARQRYPVDRKGQLTRKLAEKVSDSQWHQQLSESGDTEQEDNPYWLVPFQNYRTMCPYLVGSYDRVADEIACYIRTGCTTFILDEPASAEEMRHIGLVFERASERRAAA